MISVTLYSSATKLRLIIHIAAGWLWRLPTIFSEMIHIQFWLYLDCTKALDVLFKKVLDRNLPAIVYNCHPCTQREQCWTQNRALVSSIQNRKQCWSWVAPPDPCILLLVDYITSSVLITNSHQGYDFFHELRAMGVGCNVGDVYMGAVGFAEDILLLVPSRCAMEVLEVVLAKLFDEWILMWKGREPLS